MSNMKFGKYKIDKLSLFLLISCLIMGIFMPIVLAPVLLVLVLGLKKVE